jgi:nitrate reductase beta subunit
MTPTALRKRQASPSEKDLYAAQMSIFLDPNDPAVIEQARRDGVPEAWLEGAPQVADL